MQPKRFRPDYVTLKGAVLDQEIEQDNDYSQHDCLKKQRKTQAEFFEDYHQPSYENSEFFGHFDQNLGTPANLYEIEFKNFGEYSFKTISKAGQDAFLQYNSVEQFAFDQKCRLSKKKKKPSTVLAHDQIPKNLQNRVRYQKGQFKKTFIRFGSLNQISKSKEFLDDKSNNQNENMLYEETKQKMKKKQNSFTFIPEYNVNTINTQLMDQIGNFSMYDQNQIQQFDLKKMTEKALIKNVKIQAKIKISLLESENKTLLISSALIYKTLEVDGYTINGFYLFNQKIRLRFKQPITNKKMSELIKENLESNNKNHCFYEYPQDQQCIKIEGEVYERETYNWKKVTIQLYKVNDFQN